MVEVNDQLGALIDFFSHASYLNNVSLFAFRLSGFHTVVDSLNIKITTS